MGAHLKGEARATLHTELGSFTPPLGIRGPADGSARPRAVVGSGMSANPPRQELTSVPLFNCVVSMSGDRQRTAALARLLLDRGADPTMRASLRKAVRFADDESLHEYRDVTPLEWGERFHERRLVNEAVVPLLRTMPDE